MVVPALYALDHKHRAMSTVHIEFFIRFVKINFDFFFDLLFNRNIAVLSQWGFVLWSRRFFISFNIEWVCLIGLNWPTEDRVPTKWCRRKELDFIRVQKVMLIVMVLLLFLVRVYRSQSSRSNLRWRRFLTDSNFLGPLLVPRSVVHQTFLLNVLLDA